MIIPPYLGFVHYFYSKHVTTTRIAMSVPTSNPLTVELSAIAGDLPR